MATVVYTSQYWCAIWVLATATLLSACTVTRLPISKPPAPEGEMRPLSTSEKAALARSLADGLPNAGASQFKWLPVPANSSGAIGYCGLIDVQLTQDANATPRRFFAMISKGPSGEYNQGRIEHIEGVGRESGLTDENCKEWGYTDFSGAN